MIDIQSLLAPKDMHERYETYRDMRQTMPVLNVPKMNMWFLFNYEDVYRATFDYALFSSDFHAFNGDAVRDDPDAMIALDSLVGSDPPKHRKLRDLVTRAFTPRAVERLEPRIKQLVDHLLDQVIEMGCIDVVADLGEALPVIVISDMMGIPESLQHEFKRACDTAMQGNRLQGEKDVAVEAANAFVMAALREIFAQRRADPRDDLISDLIAAEVDDEHLTDRDLLAFCMLLLIAGNETTAHLIANTMLALMDNPQELVRLRENRALITTAIEEGVRYYTPALINLRTTTQEITLSGQVIPAKARLMPILASANRDEAKFTDADRFDISRSPNPHIGFGMGIHYCVGAPLARLETRIVLNAILDRLHNIEPTFTGAPQVNPGLLINALKTLPLRFTATERILA